MKRYQLRGGGGGRLSLRLSLLCERRHSQRERNREREQQYQEFLHARSEPPYEFGSSAEFVGRF
jgi:hypothetical protein